MPFRLTALSGLAMLVSLAPALADDTRITCVSPDESVRAIVDVAFNDRRTGGEIGYVRVETPHLVLSNEAGENGTEHPDSIAFQDVQFDSLQVAFESFNVGPVTFNMRLVRTASYEPGNGPESDPVVAGVANVASVSPVTLVCTGW